MSDVVKAPSARTELRRRAQRGRYDRETIDSILDAGLVCHVAASTGDGPVIVPMAYARDGDWIYLHGSTGNRLLRALRDGAEACVCVTLLDGLVIARSAFHQSMNYRCVILYGRAEEIADEADKRVAMERLVEHVVPGRSADIRGPSATELRQTLVLRIPIREASAKVRGGPPVDDEEDLAQPCWAGVLPLALEAGVPEVAPDLRDEVTVPGYLTRYGRGR